MILAFAAGALVAGTVFYFTRSSSAPVAPPASTEMAREAPVATEPAPDAAAPPAEPARNLAPAPKSSAGRPAPTGIPVAVNRPEAAAEAAAPAPTSTPAPAPAPATAVNPAPEPAAPVRETPRPAPPPPPQPRSVTIPEGTTISVRLAERISTETHKDGDTFTATLAQPLVVDGLVLAERNARVQGRVTQSVQAGRVKGLAQLGLELTSFTTADNQRVNIQTAPFIKTAESTRGRDAAKVGAGAAIGAAIGAIAGGGRGAAIGAGAGGAAGAGTVMVTRGKPAELPSETRLTFRITAPVTVTEKLR